MQHSVMKDAATPASIKNLISNSLMRHNQLQYNPSVSCHSRDLNDVKPAFVARAHQRLTRTPYKVLVRPETYSNFMLNNTFKYGVGSRNIYSDGVYTR